MKNKTKMTQLSEELEFQLPDEIQTFRRFVFEIEGENVLSKDKIQEP